MSSVEYRSNPFSRSYQNPIQWMRSGSTLLLILTPELWGAERSLFTMENTLSSFRQIIAIMPNHFDAHDFILKLIQINTFEYFSIIHHYDESIALTHAHISNFLVGHEKELSIHFTGKRISLDVFQNPTECAVFEKL